MSLMQSSNRWSRIICILLWNIPPPQGIYNSIYRFIAYVPLADILIIKDGRNIAPECSCCPRRKVLRLNINQGKVHLICNNTDSFFVGVVDDLHTTTFKCHLVEITWRHTGYPSFREVKNVKKMCILEVMKQGYHSALNIMVTVNLY